MAAIPALALLLAGCAGGVGGGNGDVGPEGVGNADEQGLFGSSMQTTTVRPTGNAASTAPATTAANTSDTSEFSCPRVEVRGGAAAWQVTDPSDGGLRYQATLGQFARECRYSTPDMNMRIGIQGRVLLGTKGGPGKVNVPIRLAVVEEGPVPKSVWTKFYSVPVEIGPSVMQVDFSLVADDVNFPRPDAATLDRYIVYVGFDPQGANEPKPARPRQQQARPKPVQAQPKPVQPRPVQQAAPAATPAPAAQTAPAAPSPTVSAPAPITAPAASAPAASTPRSGDTQWIGAPAPSTGGFSQ